MFKGGFGQGFNITGSLRNLMLFLIARIFLCVGGQASKAPYEEDEEILNGRQTQQYYDQMIAQINDKIAKAVERGQSPYAVYAANDDEESDWC